ncbi:Tyrosine-protein kinase SPK-1 [Taenia solium]|eukprot:TsM_001164900 transcript=TsM_001164900 gene=TsM_001164900
MSGNSTWAFALYDCDAEQAEDLAFRAGDLLHILQSPLMGADENWIIAVNPRTGCKGDVPCNYITYERGYSAALDAFKETDRSGATKLLQSQAYLHKFNYVVRPSSERTVMALSIRNAENFVRHYRIYFNSHDQSCSLFQNQTFKTIEDLVIYYMENEIAPGYILRAYESLSIFPPLL